MFSHNGMISEKQLSCILMLSVFSGSIFVLPYLFAVMFGSNMVTGVAVFIIMAALYVGLLVFLGNRKMADDVLNITGIDKDTTKSDNTLAYKYCSVIIRIVRYIIRFSFYIILAVAILSEGQVPFVDRDAGNSLGNLMVLLPLVLVAFYGADRNVEKQGRISEMIYWAAFFPYVIMILFGLKEMDYSVLIPTSGVDLKLIMKCYALLTFIVPIEIYPQLKLNTNKHRKASVSRIYLAVMLMIILVGLLSLFMAGIYGLNGMSGEAMVSIAIMRYIELPLGVLQRFDVLMVWFFMTGVFAIMSSTLFNIRKQLFKLVSKKMGEIILLFIALTTLFMCLRLPKYESLLGAYIVYGALVDVPLSLISAVWEYKKGNKRTKTQLT